MNLEMEKDLQEEILVSREIAVLQFIEEEM